MRKIFLGICMICMFLFGITITEVKADPAPGYYPSITLNVPRMSQYPKGCGIACMGQGEGYFFDQTDRTYNNSAVYSLVRSYNKASESANWHNVGWQKKGATSESAYLTALYNQLASGYPCIVFRRSNGGGTHYATVYAYNGSTSTLSRDGFKVVNTNQSLSYVKRESLKAFLTDATPIDIYDAAYPNQYKYIVRRSGIPNPSSLVKGITFAVCHPPFQHKQGTTNAALGTVSSNCNLTNVTVGVYDLAGNKKFAASATPNAKYYDISKLDSKMTFRSLPNGNYDYIITAKDANGAAKSYVYRFKVVSSAVKSTAITFTYNINGGTGSISPHTLDFGTKLTIPSTVNITREGYTLKGFAAYRVSDKKYYTINGKGWQTQEQINANGYEKKAYLPGESYTINYSWLYNPYVDNQFILAAIWEKDAEHNDIPGFIKHPFADVNNPTAYYYKPVVWAVENNITAGIDATHFAPDAGCTRGQVVTFLCRAAGSPAPTTAACTFMDVQKDAYYYNAVLWAVENGITSGYSSAQFAPDEECTRAQIVTFLWRYHGEPDVGSSGILAANAFGDISQAAYYFKAVAWAVDKGITYGVTSSEFKPNDVCTRGQIVTFLYRAKNV